MAFSTKMTLPTYLALDDHAVSEFLRACGNAADATLKELSTALLGRKLFKAVEASEAQSRAADAIADFKAAAIELLSKNNLDPEYFLVSDTPGDTPYKPYDPDEDKPATQIYVATTLGEVKEIRKQSDAIGQLTKPYNFLRYYFPGSLREEMDTLARDKLRKE